MSDYYAGTHIPILAARFHNSLTRLFLDICINIRNESSCNIVALTGGVWQNRLLFEKTFRILSQEGFIIFVHNHIPANDGGISLGQAVIAAKTHHQS